jgi:hypothetical protein
MHSGNNRNDLVISTKSNILKKKEDREEKMGCKTTDSKSHNRRKEET